MRVLIVVIMGRSSEFSACIVCQVVRLYNVMEIVVMSGGVACCSVVCGTLLGVSVFSIMCSELLIMVFFIGKHFFIKENSTKKRGKSIYIMYRLTC